VAAPINTITLLDALRETGELERAGGAAAINTFAGELIAGAGALITPVSSRRRRVSANGYAC
jgi:hypothetical protein